MFDFTSLFAGSVVIRQVWAWVDAHIAVPVVADRVKIAVARVVDDEVEGFDIGVAEGYLTLYLFRKEGTQEIRLCGASWLEVG